MDTPLYSSKLDEAIALAASSFRCIRRKGTNIPYLSHLLQVLVLVAEGGGDEEQMIAAVLHDYLEDIRDANPEKVKDQFGARVLMMVEALSDTTEFPKPPWKERKLKYLEHLATMDGDVKLVSAADKYHNAMSIQRDFQEVGAAVWERFSATREETLWYYRGVIHSLEGNDWNHWILDRLKIVVQELHRVTGVSYE